MVVPPKEPKSLFYISPGIIDSELRMWGIKLGTKKLTLLRQKLNAQVIICVGNLNNF